MATVDTSKLEFRQPKDRDKRSNGETATNGGAAPLQYDPHLREEKHRRYADQSRTIAITRERGDRLYVNTLARLKKPGEVPGLIVARTIGDIVTGSVDVDDIETVRGHPLVASLKAATETYLDLYNSAPAIHCDPESLERGAREVNQSLPGLDGSGVIVGVVDFGCDFRHKNFRQPSGATRIRYLWDQTGDTTELSPRQYGYGREFSADLLNQALQDEKRAYESLKYTPDVAAHGTHVMDIAAGNGREPNDFGGRPGPVPGQLSHPGIAPNAQLIFVHLRTFAEGFLGNSRHLLEAVEYIFSKADELGLPAVVNLSLSSFGGPHDGTTLVEQGLAALVNAKPGRAIVVSAGNGYTKQSHVSGKVGKDKRVTILWHTDRRNADPQTTKNEMEIWYPGGRELQVTLYAPDSEEVGSVDLGDTKDLYEGEARLGHVSHRLKDPNNGDNQIDIRLPHLENVEGPWRIELALSEKDKGEGEIEFHAWIEQDDRGLSRFEGATPDVTIGSISCNDATVTVGAFDTALNACLAPPFAASSAGPTRPTKKQASTFKPDLSAPGVNIVAARARGGVTAMSGTSMAAPHVTGLVALLFQLVLRAGYDLPSFDVIRGILSEPDGGQKPAGPKLLRNAVDPCFPEGHPQLGAGRVDGQRLVRFVAGLLADPKKLQERLAKAVRKPFPGLQADKPDNGHDQPRDFHVPAPLLQKQPPGKGRNGSQKSRRSAKPNGQEDREKGGAPTAN